ncbi:MAG: BamA/TamA family outer membrane protein [Saprospiraceae bacterium]
MGAMSNFQNKTPNRWREIYFALLCTLSALALPAQTATLRFALHPAEQAIFWENIHGFQPQPFESQGDTATFQIAAQASPDSFCLRLLDHFRQKSFLLASIEFGIRNSEFRIPNSPSLTLGPPLRWVSLRAGTGLENENWLAAAGFREPLFAGKPLRYDAVLKLEQAVLEQAENNGYPFATVWLDSVDVREDGSVSAILQIDRKRFFVFKTLKINGDVKLPKAFLLHYLGIKPGTPYSRARVLRLREPLRSLLFLEPTANPSVTFSGNPAAQTGEATINLFLKKKRASRFDFIIGLLPQPESANGKLLLSGSLSAAFQNALNLGERFSAELERLRPETQKVDVQASVPYLLGSAFGAEGRLGIFRRDSTWTDAQGEAGISYLFAGADFVRFFWENKSSSLQKVDTLAVLASRQLPPNLDFGQNGFGLETSFTRLDYRFNPRRGWSLTLKAAAGFNTVRRNTQIENLRDAADPDFSFSMLYDSVAGRSARYRAELRGEVFVPVFVRSTIKIGLRGGGIFSEKPVFGNEQYRLGGNKLLRGFDEESLFATRFVVGTAEWRLLIGPNSFLAAFADWGYLENLTRRNRSFLRPLGLGAGLNFETRAGIFGISAAVGRRDVGQPMNLRATKFHLGYVSLF